MELSVSEAEHCTSLHSGTLSRWLLTLLEELELEEREELAGMAAKRAKATRDLETRLFAQEQTIRARVLGTRASM